MTIALIEIGSRAVRLLVACEDKESGIKVLFTGVEPSPAADDSMIAAKLSAIVAKFVSTSTNSGISEIIIFGTESLRKLDAVSLRAIEKEIPNLRVLTPLEEASACHASACLVAHAAGLHPQAVISGDIGSGSFELSLGDYALPGQVGWCLNTGLGSISTQQIFLKGGRAAIAQALGSELRSNPFPIENTQDTLLFFSGSAATKFAWLMYRAQMDDKVGLSYNPRAVQGKVVLKDELISSLTGLDIGRGKNRMNVAKLVSPENPAGPEVEILLAGMQIILTTMDETKQSRFLVNAYGGRHGIAWLRLTGRNI